MNSATFLLAMNAAIGLSFAVAFLALTGRSSVRLGRWCAAGFLSAAATVGTEALAPLIPSVRLVSALSFSLLMLALAAITAGLVRHYRAGAPIAWIGGLAGDAALVNALVVFDLPRGTWGQALGYQGPYIVMLALACGLVAALSPRRPVDLILAAVLGLSALQFLVKAILSGMAGRGPGVRDYIVSPYAFYSQTAGGILSLCLGLALLGLITHAVIAESRLRLQRDDLSGTLTRAAFLEAAARIPRRPAALILADLDRFKAINDRFGHAAGDEVIRSFGADLRACFGEDAVCGRLGGEEFCILVPGGTPSAVQIHLQALQWLGRQNRYRRVPPEVIPTASFGVAFTEPGEPFEDTLHRADMALYAAKEAGRDGYRFASPRGADRASAPAAPPLDSAVDRPSGPA